MRFSVHCRITFISKVDIEALKDLFVSGYRLNVWFPLFFQFLRYFVMHRQGFLHQKALLNRPRKNDGLSQIRHLNVSFLDRFVQSHYLKATTKQYQSKISMVIVNEGTSVRKSKIKSIMNENIDEVDEEEDELCPVECVKEFMTEEEFSEIMEKAKVSNALVVVDFYRTSCGSCKYIEQGFIKLCKGSADEDAPVIFLKHNVIDEYDEQSETAERLRIRSVPLFHFYKNGVLLEAFATRDKERVLGAIQKYTSSSSSIEVNSVS